MKNKKVLFCSEASWLSTGYAVYTKEVLSRLRQIDGLEVAELACYVDPTDVNIPNALWKIYPNKPAPGDAAYDSYKGNVTAQFGDQTFNAVMLDFQPDVVMDIRDWWMIEFQQRSPFRDFFHWAIMPTVDALPQANQWINTFATADSVFAYSEFGRDVMLHQCNNMNFVDIASPSASQNFQPVSNKQQHKLDMGVSPESLIIGTVMRNQKRKLYPDLLRSFRIFLDQIEDPNVFLYCHTYYPDVGWDIPALIHENGLSNRVLMTYKCKNCQDITVDFFQDAIKYCHKCQHFNCHLVGINNSISEPDLAKIYNLFDIYVQYANSEGFGMPQLEAANCAIPVISTYYSAMQSVVDNIGAIGIPPLSFYTECETGCNRAVPNNELFINTLISLHKEKYKLPDIGRKVQEKAIANYSWDKTADAWAKRIMSLEQKDPSTTWLSQPQIIEPATEVPAQITSITDKVNFIFENILHKPQWIGNYLWKRVLRDLTFGYRCENLTKDFYFSESHVQSYSGNTPFSVDQACQEMINFRNQINRWEEARLQMMQQKGTQ